ncbi:relaxase/mobilization nuclease domain-containing protein [Echinicola vietnamensis]|uniref:Relaxase/mobilization nuclease n=1 Tax=Echinicola vietnamensis (strain DSM 17526 / LMG 23754 / KMM 6221) TaxID=926556 RepID=L0FY57_ECHVK|nr:relaxase/mobilization nuclease domain-containing protein [Echinicola vietnamensis]AGA78232.1 relaxase/mobilization nuclease [Echinicola vietnamensis DSM 17526]
MVARITSGKTIRGVLHYNENKVEKRQAKFLGACGYLRQDEELDFQKKLARFQKIIETNTRAKTNALHISLNFSPRDKVDEPLLWKITEDYMRGIGFGEQPYLVYRHFDAAHPHIHVVTTNIREDGQRIETHNLGRVQSEKTRKDIEQRYGLVKAEEQQRKHVNLLQSLDKAEYGKTETKAAISNIVGEVVRHYKFTSLAELNAILRQFNVTAYRGEEDSKMYQKKGLIYSISDANGNRRGVPIKASSIYSKPTYKKLEMKFELNRTARKNYRNQLRSTVNDALTRSSSLEDLQVKLRKKGVHLTVRKNEEGKVYGITFTDHIHRCVFNGSSLGKEFSANGIQKAMMVKHTDEPQTHKQQTGENQSFSFPTNPQTSGYEPTPYELSQKKRKKKRRKKNL